MNELQLPLPTKESVETVDVSWLHHSQKGEWLNPIEAAAATWVVLRQLRTEF